MSTDFVKVGVAICAILLIVGAIPFTAGWVGGLLLATTFELKVTW